ncbi:MAG TPA: thiolase family protein [Solirubrobacterales bacterium]|jgi:acetyl-CoA acetyltransferase
MSFPAAAVVGVHATPPEKSLDRELVSVLMETARAALADAGMELADVDGISARWPGPGGSVVHPNSVDWTGLLGQPMRWVGDTYPQGIPGVLDAAAAIEAGYCSTVLVFGGQSRMRLPGKVAGYTQPENEFTSPWGAYTTPQFAMIAQSHLHRHPASRQATAEIAATIRNFGSDNPEAVLRDRGPFTAEDVLASPMVSTPLHLLDLCLVTEGAVAIVVTSAERAKGTRAPVSIVGGGLEWQRQQYVDSVRYEDVWTIGADAIRRSYAAAGIGPQDIDVAELYDINSFEVLRQLEVWGICGAGEGVDYVAEHGIGLDSPVPVNSDGGLMAYSHIGYSGNSLKIVESVHQLRGEAPPERQVPGAEVAAMTGAGSAAQYFNVMLMGRGA